MLAQGLQSIKTDPETIQLIEFVDTVITTIFHMYEKVKET